MGHKLLLSFSLVFLLTLAIAAGGWRTANAMLASTEQTALSSAELEHVCGELT